MTFLASVITTATTFHLQFAGVPRPDQIALTSALVGNSCWTLPGEPSATGQRCHRFQAFKNEGDIKGKAIEPNANLLIKVTESKPTARKQRVFSVQFFARKSH